MKIDISRYYCKTTDPAFDEYVELAREQYGDRCVNNLAKLKDELTDIYVAASSCKGSGSWDWSAEVYLEQGLLPFTAQHIKEQVMNDKIMKAVVALKGDLSNVVNHHIDMNNAISLFSDGDGYWLTISTFEELCNCDRAKKMDLTPICTVEEFGEAAAKWRANQPKPQEVNPDVIPFEFESGKHAVKVQRRSEYNDHGLGLVVGEFLLFGAGYDFIPHVKDSIVAVYGVKSWGFGLNKKIVSADNLELIWEKPVKTPQQLEVERLQKLLVDTQAELNKLTGSDTGGLNG